MMLDKFLAVWDNGVSDAADTVRIFSQNKEIIMQKLTVTELDSVTEEEQTMTTRKQVETEVVKKAQAFYEKGCIYVKIDNAPDLKVTFKLTGVTAGHAFYHEVKVDYNLDLGMSDLVELFTDTVPHEVAHIIAYLKWGDKIEPHGWQWRFVMEEVFHVVAVRCHHIQMKVNNSARTYHNYRCLCPNKNYILSEADHKKMQDSRYGSRCPDCKHGLIYVSTVKGKSSMARAAESLLG